ncbi:hypothetical protein RVR_6974 [Actinacidiphila reveromycinica]|uniref:Uncharacterized protein n=1 Tax=Actinacidiphila reveromycinica TaxID=659352 RepID=A0A7U3UWK1_9ACTN|nr:hypothetical protein [Streptomyces sp. SN-593]BBB00080.1 hypothetical protein RVR_6974 [Streptomyces sp. SN-593]
MSGTWAFVPACPSIVLLHRHRFAAVRLRATGAFRLPRGAFRADRPAWQSPYGPPRHRSARGRWAPEPGVGRSLPAARHGPLCSRCD